MPLIQLFVAPSVRRRFPVPNLPLIGQELTEIVEEIFDIRGRDDVEFRVIYPQCVLHGDDLEIEISYTVGVGEYEEGVFFEPSQEQRKALCEKIIAYLTEIASWRVGSVSVWVIPYCGTTYSRAEMPRPEPSGDDEVVYVDRR